MQTIISTQHYYEDEKTNNKKMLKELPSEPPYTYCLILPIDMLLYLFYQLFPLWVPQSGSKWRPQGDSTKCQESSVWEM